MATPEEEALENIKKARIEFAQYKREFEQLSGKKFPDPFEGMKIDDIIKKFGGLDKAMDAIRTSTKGVRNELSELGNDISTVKGILSSIGDELKALQSPLKAAKSSYRQIQGVVSEIETMQADILSYDKKQISAAKDKSRRAFLQLRLQRESLKSKAEELNLEIQSGKFTGAALRKKKEELNQTRESIGLASDELKIQDNINILLDNQSDRIGLINNGVGITGKLLEGVGAAAEKIGFKGFGAKVEAITEEMKELSFEMTEGGTKALSFREKLEIMTTGLGSSFSALASQLKDPLVIIGLLTAAMKKLVDIGMHLSQEITDLGRSFNLSREAAEEMFNSIKKAAVASGSLVGTTKDMLKAQMSINDIMGTRILLTGEELETQVALTKLAGLSNEQAAELYKYSLLTGKSSEDLYDAIAAQGEGLFNNRQILQEALEVEGQLAAQYKNDPKLIAAAVRQVKKLGINLQQAQGIAKSMLDFESSIEAELEAQLLTGKQLNLSKVRELAMRGDTAEAAALALKQAGSLYEFQNMNVIAQESLANAMNMSTDELAESLKKQESLNTLMAQNPGLDRQQATLQAQRDNMSASEKMNASMSKLSDAFAKVVGGPVTFAVDAFSKIVGGLASMPGLAKIIAGGGIVLGGLALLQRAIPPIINYFKRAVARPTGSTSEPISTNLTQETIQSLNSASGAGGTGGSGGGYTDAQGRYRDKKTGRYKKQPGGTKGTKMKAPKMKGAGMMSRMGGAGGAIMSGLGMAAQAAPIAASMFGRNLEQQGADAGNRTKETVGSSLAQAGDVGVAKQSVGLLGGLGGKVGGLLSKLNPMEAVKKTVGKFAPKILSSAPKMAKRIPVLGAAIESIFAAKDIAGMISSGMPQDDIYQNIGRRAFQAIGGILGGAGASLAIQAANIVPGLGVILTPLAGIAGDFIGRSLGGLFADASPSIAGSVGKGLSSIFPGGDQVVKGDKVANTAGQIKTPTPEVKLAAGGIVSQPTQALVGEAGPEAVMPLDALYRKFDELIQAVNKGGSVYIDGNKAGEALVMGTYKSA